MTRRRQVPGLVPLAVIVYKSAYATGTPQARLFFFFWRSHRDRDAGWEHVRRPTYVGVAAKAWGEVVFTTVDPQAGLLCVLSSRVTVAVGTPKTTKRRACGVPVA